VSFAIENYHRELKQNCGVERCQARSERAQRNHIGLALRAFLRLEWHFFTTGVSGFEGRVGRGGCPPRPPPDPGVPD
jgi:putative transposase